MEGAGMGVLGAVWTTLAVVILVAGIRAQRSARALRVGRMALALLFVVAGAGANAAFLLTGADFAGFADLSYLDAVRDTWRSVVAPNQELFIGLLIAYEATVGLLVLSGGRRAQIGMIGIIGFHVALLSFGWGFYAWSAPMLVALSLLLRAQRAQDRAGTLRDPVLAA